MTSPVRSAVLLTRYFTVVERPFAFTDAFSVALLAATPDAIAVVADGLPPNVVKLLIAVAVVEPALFVAAARK